MENACLSLEKISQRSEVICYRRTKLSQPRSRSDFPPLTRIFHWIEHDNPSDYHNTALKIAKKRALVDVALCATAASDVFSHEIESVEEEQTTQRDAKRTGPGGRLMGGRHTGLTFFRSWPPR